MDLPSVQSLKHTTALFVDRVCKALGRGQGATLKTQDVREKVYFFLAEDALEAVPRQLHPMIVPVVPSNVCQNGFDTSDKGIALQINGPTGIVDSRWLDAEVARQFPLPEGGDNSAQLLFREMLVQNTQIFGQHRMTDCFVTMNTKIEEQAREFGVENPRAQIYYFVPWEGKSFGMMTMLYCRANDVRQSQIVCGFDELAKRKLGTKAVIVVLDDVSGTGRTLQDFVYLPMRRVCQRPIIIAPMISSDFARRGLNGVNLGHVKGFDFYLRHDNKLAYLPGTEVAEYSKTPIYLSSSTNGGRLSRAVSRLVGMRPGYGGIGWQVVTAVSSPNNNHGAFAPPGKLGINNQFTFNGVAGKPGGRR